MLAALVQEFIKGNPYKKKSQIIPLVWKRENAQMKIVHVVPGPLHKGGIGIFVQNLCESLAKQGNSVSVYYVDKSAIQLITKRGMLVSVKRFRPIIGDPFYLPSYGLAKNLEREDAVIIHTHNIHTLLPLYVVKFGKLSSEKMVLQPHYHERGQNIARSMLFSIYGRVLKSTVFRCFDAIIANSEYERACLERDFPSVSSKIVLVPEEYSLTVPSHIRWEPAVEPRRLLYVGALNRYKNVEILIRAFKTLTLKWKDIKLVIVGDGPEKHKLKELALRLGIDDKITFKHGLPGDELQREYATASAVVLLSTLESFSRVAHEAIAVGTPLIVYDYGPLSALVDEGLAKAVNSLNPEKVAAVINEILDSGWKPAKPKLRSSSVAYVDLIIRLYESLL